MPATVAASGRSTARASDSRSAAEIGRRAALDLVFAVRRGRTVLTHGYAEPPFRAGRLFDRGPLAHLMLVWCGPGIFAGDRLTQRIRVERGAHVLLVSQAALQVHPSDAADPAFLDSSFDVDEEASLDCFWDPLIPFAGARVRQRTEIRIGAGGQLFWSDALMSGRASRGEAWRFETLDHELRVSVGGSLTYLERYVLEPGARGLQHPWRAGAADYIGTTIVCGESASVARAEEAQQRLASIESVRAGVDSPSPNLIVGRVLGERGPQFAAARAILRNVFDRPRLRKQS